MKWIALVSLLAGCDYLFNLDHIEPAREVDASMGMVLDAGPCVDGTVYGRYGLDNTGLLAVCVPDMHVETLNLTSSINTNLECDAVLSIDSLLTQVCVKYATDVLISGGVQTRGDRPLVVVATHSMTVDGVLDLSSKQVGTPGAGNNWLGCTTPNGTTGGGGGPGGSAGTRGGAGAAGLSGTGRPARSTTPIDRVRGGCPGGTGGTGAASSLGGPGGTGGGAVYLIAGTSITIGDTATINASGAGGAGGTGAAVGGGGGGGGGSGGLVGLDAPMVVISPGARILANGGGGGGGGGGAGMPGTAGSDPSPSMLSMPASGGSGGTDGAGRGGTGGAGIELATAGTTAPAGGGGGGGAGYIVISTIAPIACALCSPPAMSAP